MSVECILWLPYVNMQHSRLIRLQMLILDNETGTLVHAAVQPDILGCQTFSFHLIFLVSLCMRLSISSVNLLHYCKYDFKSFIYRNNINEMPTWKLPTRTSIISWSDHTVWLFLLQLEICLESYSSHHPNLYSDKWKARMIHKLILTLGNPTGKHYNTIFL